MRGRGEYRNNRGRGEYQYSRGRGEYQNNRGRGEYQKNRGREEYQNNRGRGEYQNNRGRGEYHNNRGQGRHTAIRGRRYPNQEPAWKESNNRKVTIEHKPLPEESMSKSRGERRQELEPEQTSPVKKMRDGVIPPGRESMHDFFKDIETLPDEERNHMIQVCIKELIEENKLLRDANRRLVQKHRNFPGMPSPTPKSLPVPETKDQSSPNATQLEKDVSKISLNGKKPMNAQAPEFQMKSPSAAIAPLPHELYKQQNDPENMRYEDYVRMRRAEQDRVQYEEMVAEQMYLEELEMRQMREAELYGGFDERAFDPRFGGFDERAYHDPRLADPRFYADEYAYHY